MGTKKVFEKPVDKLAKSIFYRNKNRLISTYENARIPFEFG